MDKLITARNEINAIDKSMSELFVKRMNAVRTIAQYKHENGMPILDSSREKEVIDSNSKLVDSNELRAHYINFLKSNMKISRSYQAELYPELSSGIIYEENGLKKIPLSLDESSYDILLGCGAISLAGKYFKLDRKVLILTDSGVPAEYSDCVAKQCLDPFVYTIESGEQSKSIQNFEKVLAYMAQNRFTRTDCVIAVGGGVVGDLAGFVAASYMRGVDFYNIPTTLLSQVDSSIGGKVAIDLGGYKNIVGAFYQPKCVIVDPELLLTLDIRQVRSGLAESLKMATTSDPALFEMFENDEYLNDIELVILRSLLIKRAIVERDVKEGGERRILNFGHTVGHAIESKYGVLHGEAVALGMLYMCDKSVRSRLLAVIEGMGLPTEITADTEELYELILRDKKADGNQITLTYVKEIGKAELIKTSIKDIKDLLDPSKHGGIQ